jgi:hypothetical protein
VEAARGGVSAHRPIDRPLLLDLSLILHCACFVLMSALYPCCLNSLFSSLSYFFIYSLINRVTVKGTGKGAKFENADISEDFYEVNEAGESVSVINVEGKFELRRG